MSQKKKRQHYVPRMLLRKFSRNKKTIGMYALASGVYNNLVGIKEQCYENYFYGKDGKLEEALASFETDTAPVLDKLTDKANIVLSKEDRYKIYRLVTFQECRTKRALDDLDEMTDKMIKEIFKHEESLKDVDLEKFKIKNTAGPAFLLKNAIEMMDCIFDLEIKILDNATNIPFLTSDHPVVLFNQWAMFHTKFKKNPMSFTGLMLKGLVVTMPVSQDTAIVIYDPGTYKCGNKKGMRVKLDKIEDVEILNRLQVINCSECVYFGEESKLEKRIPGYLNARQSCFSDSRPKLRTSEMVDRGDGTSSQLVINSRGDTRYRKRLTFLKVIDKASYVKHDNAMLPPRSWEMVRRYEERKKRNGNGNEDYAPSGIKYPIKF